MIRKNIRLRKEYLFNRENDIKHMEEFKQKQQIKKAQDGINIKKDGKRLPTELYKKETELKKKIKLDDDNTFVPRSKMDDEYSNAHLREPKILVTTCRHPSSRLVQFQKEMALLMPNAVRINRGAYVLKDIVEIVQKQDFTDLMILHEHRGEPDGIIFSHMPLGPTIYFGLKNVVLRHDLPEKPDTMSEQAPHLIFNNFSTPLGERIKAILQHLFVPAKADSKRVITFSNENDTISFRNHSYYKEDYKTVALNELGPRFEMKPYQITLGTFLIEGTMIQKEAQKEWVLRPYMNTATKRKAV